MSYTTRTHLSIVLSSPLVYVIPEVTREIDDVTQRKFRTDQRSSDICECDSSSVLCLFLSACTRVNTPLTWKCPEEAEAEHLGCPHQPGNIYYLMPLVETNVARMVSSLSYMLAVNLASVNLRQRMLARAWESKTQ